MRKILSVILAVTLLLGVIPVAGGIAETVPAEEKTGLSGFLNGILNRLSESDIRAELSGLLDSAKSTVFEKIPAKLSSAYATLKEVVKSWIARGLEKLKLSERLKNLLDKISALLSSSGLQDSAPGKLAGRLSGRSSQSVSDEEWAQWLEEYHNSPAYQDEMARNAVIEAYILNEYKDTLEAGDVPFICIGSGIDDEMEDGSWKYLRYLSLTNFTVDGTALKMKNSAGRAELLFLAKDDSGTYQITEAIQAADGENYAASIEAMSERYDVAADTVYVNLGLKDWAETYQLANYLRAHPEYEKAEYQGEYRTAEELDAIADAALDAALPDFDFSDFPF